MNDKTITENVQQYLDGEGKFEGKPVLVVNNSLAVCTGQIYSRLCAEDRYRFAVGKGLVTKGSDRQFRSLSFAEWSEAIRRIFAFARLQEQVGEAPRRLLILDEPPRIFLISVKQTRWHQYSDLFPMVNGAKGELVRP
jgi:hypothetical protein